MPDETRKAIRDGEIEEGFYKTRLVRGGVFVPVRVAYEGDRDETGELIEDERLICEVNGEARDEVWARKHWPHFAGNPIPEADYRFMVDKAAWARQHEPDAPEANPYRAVPGIGDNSGDAPTELLDEVEDLESKDRALGDPKDIDDIHKAILIAKGCTRRIAQLDAAKKEATAPLKEEIKAAEKPYKDGAASLERIKGRLLPIIDRWRKAHDGGATIETDYGIKARAHLVQKVEIDDPAKLPEAYLKPDEKAIEKALKDGKTVPGARLIDVENTIVS